MRLIVLLLAVAAAPAAAVQVMPLEATVTTKALVQKLGDESVCGLPSFTRRRACYVKFGDYSAWIYFGKDARTLESVSLAEGFGRKDTHGTRLGIRWIELDAQGRVTKARANDYDERRAGSFEQDLSLEQIARSLEDDLAALNANRISQKSERYCSEAGDYWDHMMGCCDGLREVRVSNDAYVCAQPDEPVDIEPVPDYHPWLYERRRY